MEFDIANHTQRIADFIARWGPGGAAHGLNEEQGAQQHFIELCTVLGVPAPEGGDDYVFEKGMLAYDTQASQRRGYADVQQWPPPTAGATTRCRCPMRKSCAGCWR